MAIDRPSVLRSIDFAIVAISLMVMATALGCLMFVAIHYAGVATDPHVRRYLLRLAWVTLTLLLLLVFLFIWLVVRRVSWRMRQRRERSQPTPYVDSWALAGERFKLTPQQERELDELEIDLPGADGQAESDGDGNPRDGQGL
jgi:membrane protein implicated in regulation of membrane protease activity